MPTDDALALVVELAGTLPDDGAEADVLGLAPLPDFGAGRGGGAERGGATGARDPAARRRGRAHVMIATSWPAPPGRWRWRRSWPPACSRPRARPRRRRPTIPPTLRPGEIQRLFDAYLVMEAQRTLGLSDTQFPPFLTRLRGLQEIRRQHLQARNQLLGELGTADGAEGRPATRR